MDVLKTLNASIAADRHQRDTAGVHVFASKAQYSELWPKIRWIIGLHGHPCNSNMGPTSSFLIVYHLKIFPTCHGLADSSLGHKIAVNPRRHRRLLHLPSRLKNCSVITQQTLVQLLTPSLSLLRTFSPSQPK